jgi:hypothetical protein
VNLVRGHRGHSGHFKSRIKHGGNKAGGTRDSFWSAGANTRLPTINKVNQIPTNLLISAEHDVSGRQHIVEN